MNRSKLGITLDLTSARGAESFAQLANLSDVIVCNYAYGVLDSFGFDYDSLAADQARPHRRYDARLR